MSGLGEVLARLDRFVNHETANSTGVSAGRISGLGLDTMAELCARNGDPQLAVPVIHVTGTNGKGSVAALASRLLTVNGLTVGTYSSPHLVAINERICRDGEPISDVELAEVLSSTLDVADTLDTAPSWFEIVTAAAFRWFAESGIDVAVVEVGLLGRYDATNVVRAAVSVVTNIGPDHTDFAPGWEAAIAAEKAGIVEPGGDAVLGDSSDVLVAAVVAEGPERLFVVNRDFEVLRNDVAYGGRVGDFVTPWARHEDVLLGVHGVAQFDNLALATAAVEAFFDRALDHEVVEIAAETIQLPGRCEVVARQPLVVVDGAHNAAAAEHLAQTIDEEFDVVGSRIAVIGTLVGRDPAEFVAGLQRARLDAVVATRPDTPRAADPAALARACERAGLAVERIDDPVRAVERTLERLSDEDLLVVTGSYYLVGPAREQILRHNR